ncbi:hypothetical protein [Mesorhizobium sp.]|uniref:hypothetical protein n=1 Tax=Mesorhizobium sp. TaxID=1871066 RepID=UPI000FE48B3E|nr:hypothetical protein [Mesorhizobium sp.]RWG02555.1 MAG: hypothetical protein EOQ54_19570 [Mesorhizobium sp.]RWH00814.1 MAG: hypothetical protein EOQ72_09450 [Mesorhizobium sp.]TIN43523.1 MAG: hypothetical protein E5Y25_16180 [Mesorhizobium sp.]TIR89868.1 MAG: hypothetical protein E5X08_25825 [Mesorhizobium sp.]
MKIIFVGIAIAVASYLLADALGYSEYRLFGTSLLGEGWVTTVGVLIALFGLYKFTSARISN